MKFDGYLLAILFGGMSIIGMLCIYISVFVGVFDLGGLLFGLFVFLLYGAETIYVVRKKGNIKFY